MAVAMVVTMVMGMTGLHFSVDSISEFLDRCLEDLFRGLRRIILDRYSLILKRHIETLDSFLESDVLFCLLHAVVAVEMNIENDFLDLSLRLLCLLTRLLVSEDRHSVISAAA